MSGETVRETKQKLYEALKDLDIEGEIEKFYAFMSDYMKALADDPSLFETDMEPLRQASSRYHARMDAMSSRTIADPNANLSELIKIYEGNKDDPEEYKKKAKAFLKSKGIL